MFRLKTLYQEIDKKIIILVTTLIIFPIVVLRLLGFLQPVELATYDLLFHLSEGESPDDRIVLVVWNEQDLQSTEEATMSDRTLSYVLSEIEQQQPRIIGLDLYRDIPVISRFLSKKENEVAYNRLSKIFRKNDNIYGIEKVRKPRTVRPSKVLARENRVTCSDVENDRDNYVRRAFIDCQPLIPGSDPPAFRESYYLGTLLGLNYLAYEEWDLTKARPDLNDDSLKFYKGDNVKILEDLGVFEGAYVNKDSGVDFLINWRRNKKPFPQVSVAEIMAGSISSDLFTDKIVIVGNVASSTADRHQIPTERWNKNNQGWTLGIYIQAHVASSIISAALDNRPLIRVAPGNFDYWLLVILSFMVVFINYKELRNLSVPKVLLSNFILGSVLTFSLVIFSIEAFKVGLWIPIIPAILGILGTIIVTNNYLWFKKEQDSLNKLKVMSKSLNHEIGNSVPTIIGGIKTIQLSTDALKTFIPREGAEEIEKTILNIELGNKAISVQATYISDYNKKIKNYIKLLDLDRLDSQLIDINQLIQKIAKEVYDKNIEQKKFFCLFKEDYDPGLKQVLISSLCVDITVVNLLNNAYESVITKQKMLGKKYLPTIFLSTRKKKNWIEIVVEDNGVGIPLSSIKNIFDDRFTHKFQTGIGLTLVKKYLALEKGKIFVDSKEEKYARFTVRIPRKRSLKLVTVNRKKSRL